ncbi:hypothetical protein Bpfe_008500 [Biomphalaria pfeifferi]|uniref:Uncharacterized protein n=1 Tax=Biomphalaria pfeifferi TaxID=112525 RepID=A0AAD8BW78_BIOPF|nr:hypothetical protein Bpfe_008500 [Biomphalaria pfeifferi]
MRCELVYQLKLTIWICLSNQITFITSAGISNMGRTFVLSLPKLKSSSLVLVFSTFEAEKHIVSVTSSLQPSSFDVKVSTETTRPGVLRLDPDRLNFYERIIVGAREAKGDVDDNDDDDDDDDDNDDDDNDDDDDDDNDNDDDDNDDDDYDDNDDDDDDDDDDDVTYVMRHIMDIESSEKVPTRLHKDKILWESVGGVGSVSVGSVSVDSVAVVKKVLINDRIGQQTLV